MRNSIEAGDTNSLCGSTISDAINEYGEIMEFVGDECNTENDSKEPPMMKRGFSKTFTLLDVHSAIDFIDTDGEVIVSAGQDHDIQVWNIADGKNIRRLTGHIRSVTGLKIQVADGIIISSSLDGTIRQWSLRKGAEVRKIETPNVLTCMGVLSSMLTVTGNHKGHLEIYHLVTGKLFASVIAHRDPIDALFADNIYICTTVYDTPCSLKVWMLKWGKLICIYRLEDLYKMEFTAFTLMSASTLVVGCAEKQKLYVLNLADDQKYSLELNETAGHVQHIKAMEDLLLISAVNIDGLVRLYVYLQNGFDHIGTFCCKEMDRISSLTLVKYEGTLKFILGGSSLAIIQLDDNENSDCLEELKNRFQSTHICLQDTNRGSLLSAEEIEEKGETNSVKPDARPDPVQNQSEDPRLSSPRPQGGLLEDNLKSLSITNGIAKEETKHPMKRGVVTLPPIHNSKDRTQSPKPGSGVTQYKLQGGDDCKGLRFGSQTESILQNYHHKPAFGDMDIPENITHVKKIDTAPRKETDGDKIEILENSRKTQVEEKSREHASDLNSKPKNHKPPQQLTEHDYVSNNVRVTSKDKQTEAPQKKSKASSSKKKRQKKSKQKNKKCSIM